VYVIHNQLKQAKGVIAGYFKGLQLLPYRNWAKLLHGQTTPLQAAYDHFVS
jgi:hypothetical protein